MKKTLVKVLFLLAPFFCLSQVEYVILEGDTQGDIQAAINQLNIDNNGYGTISLKGNISITQTLNVPSKITLNFFTGSKLTVGNNISLIIKGNIKHTRTQIFETSQLNHNIKIHNQPIYPEWFGLCSYQTDPETELPDNIPIQKAINALVDGGEVLIVGSKYFIHDEMDINIPSVRIKGVGGHTAKKNANDLVFANDLIANDGVTSIFNVNLFGAQFTYLNFRKKNTTNKGINATGIALNFVRSNGAKDIDASVDNCRFTHFKFCIFARGTNLKVTDNLFSACYIGIDIKSAQFDYDGPHNSNPHSPHRRGHIIDRNRFHSIGSALKDPSLVGSTCIRIRPEGFTFQTSHLPEAFTIYGHYNHITNNYADDCKTFFEGSLDRTKIDGNSILVSMDTAIKAFAGSHGSITNNLIDGSFTWNSKKLAIQTDQENDVSFPSGHGIHVKYAHFLTISNNQIFNKRFHGIFIERSKNSSIQSNTIMNFNRHRYIKRSGENPIINDLRWYDGIHVARVQDDNPSINDKYNIQNVISNNVISITHTKVEGRYGIYAGDGDDYNFIKNNFILSTRLVQPIKID